MTEAQIFVLACGALAILYGIVTSRTVLAADAGSDRMKEIAGAVQEGARAYLNRQYTTIAIVGIIIFALLFWLLDWQPAVGESRCGVTRHPTAGRSSSGVVTPPPSCAIAVTSTPKTSRATSTRVVERTSNAYRCR